MLYFFIRKISFLQPPTNFFLFHLHHSSHCAHFCTCSYYQKKSLTRQFSQLKIVFMTKASLSLFPPFCLFYEYALYFFFVFLYVYIEQETWNLLLFLCTKRYFPKQDIHFILSLFKWVKWDGVWWWRERNKKTYEKNDNTRRNNVTWLCTSCLPHSSVSKCNKIINFLFYFFLNSSSTPQFFLSSFCPSLYMAILKLHIVNYTSLLSSFRVVFFCVKMIRHHQTSILIFVCQYWLHPYE